MAPPVRPPVPPNFCSFPYWSLARHHWAVAVPPSSTPRPAQKFNVDCSVELEALRLAHPSIREMRSVIQLLTYPPLQPRVSVAPHSRREW
jgi:hypothetical protein